MGCIGSSAVVLRDGTLTGEQRTIYHARAAVGCAKRTHRICQRAIAFALCGPHMQNAVGGVERWWLAQPDLTRSASPTGERSHVILDPAHSHKEGERCMPEFPDDYIDVIAEGELEPERGMEVQEEPVPIALFLHNGQYYALRNECAHQWNPLHEGNIIRDDIECPLHGWRFSLATGAYGLGTDMCLDTYDVRVENGRVWVCKFPRPREPRKLRF